MAIDITYITGSQTASLDTEHDLTDDPETDAGIYQLVIDVAAMARADRTVIRVYEKARAADTQRLADEFVLANEQADKLWKSPEYLLGAGWTMTLEQTDGTGRAYPFSVRRIS